MMSGDVILLRSSTPLVSVPTLVQVSSEVSATHTRKHKKTQHYKGTDSSKLASIWLSLLGDSVYNPNAMETCTNAHGHRIRAPAAVLRQLGSDEPLGTIRGIHRFPPWQFFSGHTSSYFIYLLVRPLYMQAVASYFRLLHCRQVAFKYSRYRKTTPPAPASAPAPAWKVGRGFAFCQNLVFTDGEQDQDGLLGTRAFGKPTRLALHSLGEFEFKSIKIAQFFLGCCECMGFKWRRCLRSFRARAVHAANPLQSIDIHPGWNAYSLQLLHLPAGIILAGCA